MSPLVLVLLLNIGYLFHDVVSDNKHVKMEIAKCCGENQALEIDPDFQTPTCVEFADVYGKLIDLSSRKITVYSKDIHDEPTNKAFHDYFRVSLEIVPNITMLEKYYNENFPVKMPYKLCEDGALYLEYPNNYERWTPVTSAHYCVDYIVENYSEHILSDTYSFWIYSSDKEPTTPVFISSTLMVSVVFLILVLVVYILLPGLRNLGGKVLMAYVFSLLMAFLLLPIIQLAPMMDIFCLPLTTVIYFFLLASFCWMTVMSFDIWWTFRGYIKARRIHRRGETFKFLMYCIYGWGVPLAMSIAFVVINNADLSHMPWFIKPQIPNMGCFLQDGQKLVYLYVPMLILNLSNWMFFLMTAFNIWRLHRNTAVLDSSAAKTARAHRHQRNRFFIYLKLSIVMGINWILEVVSALTPQSDFWYISDAYNALIGFAIFLIFVCKKKIYRDLRARFSKKNEQQSGDS